MPLSQLDIDVRAVRKGLREAGVPNKILDGISTRARRTGRRQTGGFQSNRASRWKLDPTDPQYGTETDCKIIELQLMGMMCEFADAPSMDVQTREILEKYLGHPPVAGKYRDGLTLERLDYNNFEAEALTPRHGESEFHIGHEDPTKSPKHTPDNISWRSHRSNLIQGNMTLTEARTKLVELIARYFELGEVTIHPDEIA